MPFLNIRQYQDLEHKRALRTPGLVSVADFKDQSPRTLTVGRTDEGGSDSLVHIFIKDGMLHKLVFNENTKGEAQVYQSVQSSEYMRIASLIPEYRAFPSCTDVEFVQIAEDFGKTVDFYKFDNESDYRSIRQDLADRGVYVAPINYENN